MKHVVISFLAAAALVVAACSGGGTPTQSGATPGQTASATQAGTTTEPSPAATSTLASTPTNAPTVAATTSAPTTAPTPSGPVDVEALVPTQVGGITLTPETIAADDFLGAYEDFEHVLGDLGKSAEDLTIVQAQGSNAGEVMIVQAFRVAGADAAALMDGFLEFSKVTDDVASPITIGGKELIVQGHPDTQPQYKSYYYGYGDVVFKLAYNGDNFDEQMEALVSQLP